MDNSGMLDKETRGNRLYYWFKTSYLFYPELIRMVTKTTGLGNEIITQRAKLGKISFAFFSSAFVYRKERQNQDQIDVMIVGEVVMPEITALIQAEEARRKQEINYTVMNDQELQLRKSGRDPFLQSILSQSRIMIIGDEDKLLN